MPGEGLEKLPEDMCSFVDNLCREDEYDTKPVDLSNSSRSSSPEDSVTLGSGSSVCSEGSTSALSDTSEDAPDSKTFNLDMILAKLETIKISETPTIPFKNKGADDRHLFQTSWKLAESDGHKKSKKQYQQKSRSPGESLREMALRENQQKYQAIPRRNNKPWKKNYKRNPSYYDRQTRYEETDESFAQPQPIMVSYADGTNSLSLTTMLVEGLVVSSVVDSCHIFVNQPENPSVPQFQQLENDMYDFYSQDTMPQIFRPIAEGSLVSTPSDDGWFRGQVAGYSEVDDLTYIKFVDYGGYAWVPASQLRQLRSDFMSLPFQAVECYIANVNSAEDDATFEAASHLLSLGYVTIQLVDHSEDGMPIVALYYNQDEAMVMFTQDILDQYVLAVYGSIQTNEDLDWPPLSESEDSLSNPESTEILEQDYTLSSPESTEVLGQDLNSWSPDVSSPEFTPVEEGQDLTSWSPDVSSPEFTPVEEGNNYPLRTDDYVEYTSPNSEEEYVSPPIEYITNTAYYPPSYPHDTVYYLTHPVYTCDYYSTPEYTSEETEANEEVITNVDELAAYNATEDQVNPYKNWSQEDYEEFYGCDEHLS